MKRSLELDAALGRDLVAAVCEHFVHVHVRLGTRAGLPHHEREVAVELAVEHLVGSGGNEVGLCGRHASQVAVCERGGLLELGKRADDLGRHRLSAYGEVLVAALGLRTPQGARGNAHLSHRVVLNAVLGRVGHRPLLCLKALTTKTAPDAIFSCSHRESCV